LPEARWQEILTAVEASGIEPRIPEAFDSHDEHVYCC